MGLSSAVFVKRKSLEAGKCSSNTWCCMQMTKSMCANTVTRGLWVLAGWRCTSAVYIWPKKIASVVSVGKDSEPSMHSRGIKCCTGVRNFNIWMTTFSLHYNIFSAEKPYKCDECKYESSFMSNLTAHKRRIHKKSDYTAGKALKGARKMLGESESGHR